MTVNLFLTWRDTPFFASGERKITVNWNPYSIPKEGDLIKVCEFLDKEYDASEVFVLQEKNYTVFQWIEAEYGWTIETITWGKKQQTVTVDILVRDMQ